MLEPMLAHHGFEVSAPNMFVHEFHVGPIWTGPNNLIYNLTGANSYRADMEPFEKAIWGPYLNFISCLQWPYHEMLSGELVLHAQNSCLEALPRLMLLSELIFLDWNYCIILFSFDHASQKLPRMLQCRQYCSYCRSNSLRHCNQKCC